MTLLAISLIPLLLAPVPPVVPYSRPAEIWVAQFCPEGYRPEVYPYVEPSTGKCTLKFVSQYCDLAWDDPRGHECNQVWVVLPDTWDWSSWCTIINTGATTESYALGAKGIDGSNNHSWPEPDVGSSPTVSTGLKLGSVKHVRVRAGSSVARIPVSKTEDESSSLSRSATRR